MPVGQLISLGIGPPPIQLSIFTLTGLYPGVSSNISGLYTIVRNKKHDTYENAGDVKIPDPTIKTSFIGE